MRGLTSASRRLIAGAGAVLVLALLALDGIGQLLGESISPWLRRQLDLTREGNLPTAFSVALLALAAGLAVLRARHALRQAGQGGTAAGWAVVACFFAYLAADDALGIHEQVATAWAHATRARPESTLAEWMLSYPSYHWQILFLPLFGSMALFLLLFLPHRLDRSGWLLFLAGMACYLLAGAMDFIEGAGPAFEAIRHLLEPALDSRQVRHLMRAYEEAVEMLGTVLICAAFAPPAGGGPDWTHRREA